MMSRYLMRSLLVLVCCSAIAPALAEDWPTYRHDRLRSAVTSENLKLPLQPAWTFKSRHASNVPKPEADPNWTGYPDNVRFNLPMIAVGDAVYFTSAEEGRLVCLDAATGTMRWQYIAGAGMNRSPMFWEGRIYCGSNDGHVYCLDAKTGVVAWTYKAGPADRWLIRYGRPTSVWPVMTDVFIDNGIAYCASGSFPHDGAFLDAIDAKTGKQIWSSGRASENAWRESLAPGGHLYVTANHIWVPKDFRGFSGIAYGSGVPFRRSDGKFVGGWGGPDPESPDTRGTFWPLIGALKDGFRYTGSQAWKEARNEKNEMQRTEVWKKDVAGRWIDGDSAVGVRMGGKHGYQVVIRYDPDLCSTVLAGDAVYNIALDMDPKKGVGAGVYARDPKTGADLWTTEIPERANQLVVANGRLLVGTRGGTIYCFAAAGAGKHEMREEKTIPVTSGKDVSDAVDRIVKVSGVSEGYAVVLDCQDGQLAAELANKTKLYVCAVFRDAAAMMKAREMYVASGQHVTRIVTWLQAPGTKLPYPSYMADLIVSEGALAGTALPEDTEEIARLTKPIRGVVLLGGTGSVDALKQWTEKSKLTGWETADAGGPWVKRVAGALPNSGGWTHNYADPGNSTCSEDGVLKPPLGVAWFGPPFVRFGSNQMALICNGVFVCPDSHSLEGYDQYTGRKLWRVDAANVAGGAGQVALSPKHVYIKYGPGLVQLDLLTGKELATFHTPYGEKHPWSWFAVSEDGKTVWGAANGALFALEMESGKGNVRWQIGGPDAAEKFGGGLMEGGRIYQQGAPTEEQKAELIADMRKYFQTQPADVRDEFEKQLKERDFRQLIAIDASNGKILYRKAIDVTNAGGKFLRGVVSGGRRGYQPHVQGDSIAHNGVVVFTTSAGADKGWSVWYTGGYQNRALTAYDGATGKFLWYRFGNYRARPLVVGNVVHAEPWAYDLRTGERVKREHPISGQQTDWAWCRWDKQCGTYSASKYFLFGRSMGLGYQDLLTDQGLYTFWHSRGSCWMDCVSGGGTMIKPPVSLGCVCQWNMPFTIALTTVPTQPTAAPTFAAPGPSLPVKHLRLDYGANGDRRDREGHMWVHSDLPADHPLFLSYPLKHEWYTKKNAENKDVEIRDAVQRTAFYTPIEGTTVPFVFASTQIGLKKSTLPITTKDGQGKGTFKVRLGFAALPGDKVGQRVFDVKLNDKTVLENFDAAKEAGQPDKAIWKEYTLELGGDLTLELVSKSGADDLANLPAINALEVIRQ